MNGLALIFWWCLALIVYTYVGYAVVLFLLVRIKRSLKGRSTTADPAFVPRVTLVVPCYNEGDFIREKIQNCLELDYPEDLLHLIFITDGSTDGTPEVVKEYPRLQLLHQDQRAGKSMAENRAMQFVQTPFVVFCDANTLLNPEAIRLLVQHYADPKVGAVSGEKRILQKDRDTASGAGEGLYWKYESTLKRWDSELLTVVGAAGELVSFRSALWTDLEADTLLDDFMQSLRIAAQGYRVIYEPQAYALETASADVKEELKRKVRICAGGWQSMLRLRGLLNFLKHPCLSFLYISHRVLRWSLAPLCLLLLIPLNAVLAWQVGGWYTYLLAAQALFYAAALLGWFLAHRHIKVKALFVPYYFFIMNLSVFLGFFRFLRGRQSALWERAKRG